MIDSIKRNIYYEHTDAAAVVYYARYLYFLEQGRTEMLKKIGFTHQNLLENYDLIFVVKKIEIDYLSPAKLDDVIEIQSNIQDLKSVSLIFKQKIINYESKINCALASVKIAAINSQFKPKKIPKQLKEKLENKIIA